MKLAATPVWRHVNNSAAGGHKCCSSTIAPVARPGRRLCKPVCFKEDTRPDRIDDTTARRPTSTATPGSATSTPATPPTPSYAGNGEPTVSSTAALRHVHLGPVASVLYPALTAGTAVAALAATLAPGAVGSLLFRGATLSSTQKVLVFAAGASIIPTLVAKRRIQMAADAGILGSPVFKNMVSACLLHGVLGLVVLSQAVSLHNPILAATVGGLSGVATITTAYTLMKIRESGQLVPSAQGLLGGVLSLLTPANLVAAAYSALAIGAIAAGSVLFTSDPATESLVFMQPKDAIHVFTSRMTGAATLANAVLLFVVKRAADDGRQGSPVFRDLNAGVAVYGTLTAAGLVYALATGLAKSVPATWAYLGFTAAAALFAGYNRYSAPQV